MGNYDEQLDTAEHLHVLQWDIQRLPREVLDPLRDEATWQHRDFPTLVASRILGVDYHDIQRLERTVAKAALFVYLYSRPGDKVTQIQDGTIIDPGPMVKA